MYIDHSNHVPYVGSRSAGKSPYPYTADLLALDACRPLQSQAVGPLRRVATPLNVRAWVEALSNHPDPDFRSYIWTGLVQGFRIGFNRTQELRSAHRNMPSAGLHAQVVDEYLAKERRSHRFIGPLRGASNLHISRIGVIPKGHTPGKFRLITDLSHPQGFSVNDGIDPATCSLSYVTVDTVAQAVASLGRGALMAKVDIESAYRLIPVHPDDRPLLAVEWRGEVFCDGMLPFGLRSAPKIFNAVADALEWCCRQRGVCFIYHYLDDFIVFGPPGSDQCQDHLQSLEELCQTLCVPLAVHKRQGPTTCLPFLGIEIDTLACSLRLPEEKLRRLIQELDDWGDRKVCSRKELESLVGLLNHACKVVRPGRTFLRRMIDLLVATGSGKPHYQHHHIRLNREFRADLAWWRTFIRPWNGIGLLGSVRGKEVRELTSDASGSWGCGAWQGTSWFQYRWEEGARTLDISAKELVPIVMAAAVWGHQWKGCQVTSYCDNMAVVAVLHTRTSRDKHLMHLLRCLFFYEAQGQFQIVPKHISGSCNGRADDLSRNNHLAFLSKVPEANKQPSHIPPALPSLLLEQNEDWTSPTWIQQFTATLNKA